MTDHCPSCPFKGCPDCRYQGGTHDPSSLINHEGRPVDAAARVLYELRHPPDDECPHIPWEDTYQPGWRDDVLPLITAAAPFIAAQAAEAEREWWVELKAEKGRFRPAQKIWLAALAAAGHDVRVIRPSDLLGGKVQALMEEIR